MTPASLFHCNSVVFFSFLIYALAEFTDHSFCSISANQVLTMSGGTCAVGGAANVRTYMYSVTDRSLMSLVRQCQPPKSRCNRG